MQHSVLRTLWIGAMAVGVVGSPRMAHTQQVILPSVIAAHGLPIRADTVDALAGAKEPKNWFGFYVYAVARSTIDGRSVYLVTTNYTSKEKGTFQSDTLALDAATLNPLWRRFHARTDSASATVTGRHVTGWSLQNGKRVVLDHQLSDESFAGPMLRWIVPALPLAAGYQGVLTVFSIWKNAEDKSAFTVGGPESLELGGKRYDAWVLQSPSGARTWVDKTSNRVLQVFTPGNDRGFWLVARERP